MPRRPAKGLKTASISAGLMKSAETAILSTLLNLLSLKIAAQRIEQRTHVGLQIEVAARELAPDE